MNKKVKMKYTVAVELLILSILFTVLTVTVDVRAIGPLNTRVGLSHINADMQRAIGNNMTLYKISDLLGYLALAVAAGFAICGLVQLIRRKSLKKVDSTIYILGGLYLITIIMYVVFNQFPLNYRPVIMPGEIVPESSYPSSHTLLAFVVYGSAAKVAGEYIKNQALAKLVKWILIVLLVVTVVCRLLSGVHWFTDIVASVLIGLTLLAFFDAVRASFKSKE